MHVPTQTADCCLHDGRFWAELVTSDTEYRRGQVLASLCETQKKSQTNDNYQMD